MGALTRKLCPSRTRGRKRVCLFTVDGALKRGLVGEAFHPSENSSIAGSRLREAASCAGFLARSCGKPGDLAASGILDLCVAKFLSDRERFARGRDTPASLAPSFPILSRKRIALIFGIFAPPVFGLVGEMPD